MTQKMPPGKLFDEVADFIAQGKALLDQGALMELAGLDEQVRVLCEAVLQLSQEERLQYSDRLQELLGDLKALGDALVAQRDAIGEELRSLPAHKKANVAYRIVDASDAIDDQDEDK